MLYIRNTKLALACFITLLLLIIATVPAQAMILNPSEPPKEPEVSQSCQAFQDWLTKNQDIGGTYTLTNDLIISDSLKIFEPEAPICIDAGSYQIIVQDSAFLEIAGENISIIGEGSDDGLIRVSSMGTFLFAGSSLRVENGTAIYFEGGEETNFSLYIGSTLFDTPTVIQAFGSNAKAIVCEQPDPLVLRNVSIYTQGSSSVGVEALSDITMSNCTLESKGQNAVSVSSKEGSITGTLCSFIPESPQFIDDGTTWHLDKATELSFTLPAFTSYEDSGMPDYLNVLLEDCNDPNNTLYATLKVLWDQKAYNDGIQRNEPFTITGNLQIKEGILYDDTKTPKATFSFRDSSPIQDFSQSSFQESQYCTITFSFTKPTGAAFVKLQKSLDNGLSWTSEDITEAYITDGTGKAIYETVLKETDPALYRLKVTGSSFAGYSNAVSCTFEPTPNPEEELEEDVDGGRGGGGREPAEREPENNIVENILDYPFLGFFTPSDTDIAESTNPNNLIANASDSNSLGLPESKLGTKAPVLSQSQSSKASESVTQSEVSSTDRENPNTSNRTFFLTFIVLFCLAAAIWWFIRKKSN